MQAGLNETTLRSRPDFLSETERQTMLADIAFVALAVGRDLYPDLAPTDLDIGAVEPGNTRDVCPRERLAFLQQVWPRVQGALAALEAAPPGDLRAATREVAFDRARRVAPADLLRALRRDLIPAPSTNLLASRLRGHLPRRIREQTALSTFDTPANRLVKAVLTTFARDLADIASLATVGNVVNVAREAQRLRQRVRAALRRSPWRTLVPPPVIENLPPSLRTHGAYRLIYDTWRRYRWGFSFDWRNPLFTLPARETWVLYEYWCLFSLVAALREMGYQAKGEQGFGFAVNRSGLTFSIVQGRGATLHFAGPKGRLLVAYGRNFARGKTGANGWHSRSHAMRPDIVVEVENRLLVFDAKFKAYTRAEQEWTSEMVESLEVEPTNLPFVNDLNQMHAYRDGIHGNQQEQAVQSAWLLYVGQRGASNARVVAYPDVTPLHPFGDGEIGAVLLRPSQTREPFNELLRTLLFTG